MNKLWYRLQIFNANNVGILGNVEIESREAAFELAQHILSVVTDHPLKVEIEEFRKLNND